MDECHARSADEVRQQIRAGTHDRLAFRAALLAVPTDTRDAWLDRVLGLGAPPADGPELPRGCVPYLPCAADALIEVVERAQVGPTDVVVDVGSGVGRATAFVHLLTGAAAVGIEIQSALVEAAREVARVVSPQITNVHGDAVQLTGSTVGSVFFLYCPFSGERLHQLVAALEVIAQARPIRVCCVDVTLPECAWLAADAPSTNVTIYRSSDAGHRRSSASRRPSP